MNESPEVVALSRAIERLGSQRKLAQLIGMSQQGVSKMVRLGRPLPPRYVLAVEAATGVSKHDLAPDIYPIEEPPVPGTPPGGTPAELTQRSAGVPESLKGLQS